MQSSHICLAGLRSIAADPTLCVELLVSCIALPLHCNGDELFTALHCLLWHSGILLRAFCAGTALL